MKSVAPLLAICLSTFAAAKSLSLFGTDQQVLDSELEVPGKNPLEFCQDNSDYSLTITKVDLDPNPPLP